MHAHRTCKRGVSGNRQAPPPDQHAGMATGSRETNSRLIGSSMLGCACAIRAGHDAGHISANTGSQSGRNATLSTQVAIAQLLCVGNRQLQGTTALSVAVAGCRQRPLGRSGDSRMPLGCHANIPCSRAAVCTELRVCGSVRVACTDGPRASPRARQRGCRDALQRNGTHAHVLCEWGLWRVGLCQRMWQVSDHAMRHCHWPQLPQINTWETILWFQSWQTRSPTAYMLSCLGLVLLALAHEALNSARASYLSASVEGPGVLQEPLVGVSNPR